MLLDAVNDEQSCSPLPIWTDDSKSTWYEDASLQELQKERAWESVDHCVTCGACAGGRNKRLFGKELKNVCRTTMQFINPDKETLYFIRTLV